ncbi:MAG: hypothetical protein E6Q28_14530 [Afipia sp.]|nr:MAG: hypothetical protein E6Q28_14530 [Afipia sp.]
MSGRPIRGEPGGSAGAAGAWAVAGAAGAGAGATAAGAGGGVGVAAGGGEAELEGAAGCWPLALRANKLANAPASSALRDADDRDVISYLPVKRPLSRPGLIAGARWPLLNSLQ